MTEVRRRLLEWDIVSNDEGYVSFVELVNEASTGGFLPNGTLLRGKKDPKAEERGYVVTRIRSIEVLSIRPRGIRLLVRSTHGGQYLVELSDMSKTFKRALKGYGLKEPKEV